MHEVKKKSVYNFPTQVGRAGWTKLDSQDIFK